MKKILFFPAIIFLVWICSGCTVREASPDTRQTQLTAAQWQLTDSDADGQLSFKDDCFTMVIDQNGSGTFCLTGKYAADEEKITVVTENADTVELLYDISNGKLTLTYYENTLCFDSVKDNTSS